MIVVLDGTLLFADALHVLVERDLPDMAGRAS